VSDGTPLGRMYEGGAVLVSVLGRFIAWGYWMPLPLAGVGAADDAGRFLGPWRQGGVAMELPRTHARHARQDAGVRREFERRSPRRSKQVPLQRRAAMGGSGGRGTETGQKID